MKKNKRTKGNKRKKRRTHTHVRKRLSAKSVYPFAIPENSIVSLLKTIVLLRHLLICSHRCIDTAYLSARLRLILIYRDFQTIYTDVVRVRFLRSPHSALSSLTFRLRLQRNLFLFIGLSELRACVCGCVCLCLNIVRCKKSRIHLNGLRLAHFKHFIEGRGSKIKWFDFSTFPMKSFHAMH